MAAASALEVHALLPHRDCGDCGLSSCTTFAVAVSNRDRPAEDCPHLSDEQRRGLEEALAYHIPEVTVGVGEDAVVIGGEDVVYRHEKRYFNPAPFFLTLTDTMQPSETGRRLQLLSGFRPKVKGTTLSLDGVCLIESLGDPGHFNRLVRKVEDRHYPVILDSSNPAVIEGALELLGEQRPLIDGVDEDNWERMGELALTHGCPLAAKSIETAKRLREEGIEDVVVWMRLSEETLSLSVDALTEMRKRGCSDGGEATFPLLVEIAADTGRKDNDLDAAFRQSILGATALTRYANGLVLSSGYDWSLLALLMLRQDLWSDPRKRPTVPPGLYPVGEPGEESPVIVTTNFSSTFYGVEGDLEEAGVSAHILAVDTGGLAVTVALAGGLLTAARIRDAVEQTSLAEKASHRRLIIPGDAAPIACETGQVTGWEVAVGPRDSGGLAGYLEEGVSAVT